jgi:uncharacterized protein (DUF983 family)
MGRTDPRGLTTQQDLIRASLTGLCPRCGAPTLFRGMIAFSPRCASCGLDFAAFNVGDGPAAFLTLIVGTIVLILAVTLELTLSPPFWLQALIWVPVTLALVLGTLRLAKAALLFSEYHNQAHEGRIDPK